jgi:hypothetical protein
VSLPNGLLPVFGFVLTVGVSAPVTLGAHLFSRGSNGPFRAGLRAALAEACASYLVGTVALWAVVGGGSLWGVTTAVLVAGLFAVFALGVVPLAVGRRLVARTRDVDSETALRFATYGWPVAAFVVFGIFVAPGGVTHGTVFDLEGTRICLVGVCGIALPLAAAVLLGGVVAVLGPGLVGIVLHASTSEQTGERPAS